MDYQDPCRIIIIGLPYSGKKEVANILKSRHNCPILEYDLSNAVEEPHKEIASLCFDDYRGAAALVMGRCKVKILQHIKKRNFVNVIQVDASFKKRFANFCLAEKLEPSWENYEKFSDMDEKAQSKDYQ